MDDFDDFLNSVASPPAKLTSEITASTSDGNGVAKSVTSTYDNSNYDLDFLNDSPVVSPSANATATVTATSSTVRVCILLISSFLLNLSSYVYFHRFSEDTHDPFTLLSLIFLFSVSILLLSFIGHLIFLYVQSPRQILVQMPM